MAAIIVALPVVWLKRPSAALSWGRSAFVQLKEFRLPEPPSERYKNGGRTARTEREEEANGVWFPVHSGLPRL